MVPQMHVISRKRINEFVELHPETQASLSHWYRLLKRASPQTLNELRAITSSADRVGKLTVFNIAGNKVRLIAALHYNRQRLYIRAVLTHAE
jgi:mRNA interferase HigB